MLEFFPSRTNSSQKDGHQSRSLHRTQQHLRHSPWVSLTNKNYITRVIAPNCFYKGRYSCVGKQLALMEIRYVTTSVLHKYNLSSGSSSDHDSFQKGLADGFTLALPVTPIIFSERDSA